MSITPPDHNPRRCGVLLHPTSFPGPHGVGDLGVEAERFIDWMASADVRCWQVLPLVPPGAGNSPYSSWSAFAANPMLIDLRQLADDGLLPHSDVAAVVGSPARVDWAAAFDFKPPRLRQAARALLDGHPLLSAFKAWRAEQASWLEDAALFAVLREVTGYAPWWTWPTALRDRTPEALAAAHAEHRAAVDEACALQFLFDRQWARLRARCAAHDIEIMGDLPIYVDADSVDVWCNQGLFLLDDQGRRTEVAGVPPDGFSPTGQLWGNPLYDWAAMAEDGYRWWVERMRRAMALHDRVRIDHFRAFSAYWAVPADAEDARSGRWVDGPGQPVFDALKAALGELPIVAEDLGVVDDGVIALLDSAGLPGMKVLQFAFGGTSDNLYLPHNHPVNAVVYPGTHDNDTTLGWWRAADGHTQHHVRVYYGVDGSDIVWDFIKSAIASPAETAIVAAQDLLSLGTEARMNIPAVADGNWAWRLPDAALPTAITDRLRFLVRLYGRGAVHQYPG